VLGAEDLYNLVGTKTLDIRYKKIIKSLQSKSLNYLTSKEGSPSQFLLDTGLIIDNKPHNPLFEYFINKRLPEIDMEVDEVSDLEVLKDKLNGQEFMLFKLLLESEKDIVAREEIASAIWGVNYEAKYSEEGVDKAVSNLRKKLSKNNYPKQIKVVKSQGITLV